jgi:phosphopentomutase
MTEQAAGKDTMVGHWEMMGQIRERALPHVSLMASRVIIEEFERRTGRRAIGNHPASGTVIIEELFEEHRRTGRVDRLHLRRQRLSDRRA